MTPRAARYGIAALRSAASARHTTGTLALENGRGVWGCHRIGRCGEQNGDMRRIASMVVVVALAAAACGASTRTIPSVLPSNGQRSVILAADGSVLANVSGDENRGAVSFDRIRLRLTERL